MSRGDEDLGPQERPSRVGRAELWWSLVVALLLAAWPVRGALFDSGEVFGSFDNAAVEPPWSVALEREGRLARNPELSDQAYFVYPFYRWVSRSWRSGDAPLWNPWIYAGTPGGIANAQAGALDPQVLSLVLLEAIGGLDLFHWGFALMGWLRYAFALWGAYLLARRLGLLPAPSALAAVCFGFSGYLTLWLNHPLGHVPPFLPWLLLCLEGVRGDRPRRAMAMTALVLALAILGGHAETAFYVGAAGGLWALAIGAQDRRAGLRGLAALALGSLCTAVSLIPLTEYLNHSWAMRQRAELAAGVDFLSLGLLFALCALGIFFVRGLRDGTCRTWRCWLPGAVGLGLAALGACALFGQRGLGIHGALSLVPDLWGTPGTGGYRGELNYIEVASGWVCFPALLLALAALLSPHGLLRRRRLVIGLGALAFLLSIEWPGLLELYRMLPVVGLGATVRLASVGALMLGLLAGEGLQLAPRASRVAAVLVLVPLAIASLVGSSPPPLSASVAVETEQDELCGFVFTPARKLAGEDSRFEGWLAPGVRVDRARLRIQRIDADGSPLPMQIPGTIPLQFFDAPSKVATDKAGQAVARAPASARWFRTPHLVTSMLSDGHWSFRVDFLEKGETKASRRVGVSTVERETSKRAETLGLISAALLLVLYAAPAGGSWASWLVVVLGAIHGLLFLRGVNPTVPAEEVYPLTQTEQVLVAELGAHRFHSDAGVMTPNSGLVRGLSSVDGYDAIDVGSFVDYLSVFLPEGNALMLWRSARSLDLADPAYRLLGVGMLVMREPFEHPGWELHAGPRSERPAETWIYRARDPLPRAFCVKRVVSPDELGELYRRDPALFDPLELACVVGDWRPRTPFRSAGVDVPRWTNNEVRVQARLDGDGLLVLTDQYFPGWRVQVDGEERELLRADLNFRGVALEAGEHEVVFRYRPRSLRVGLVISSLAIAVLLALTLGSLVTKPPKPAGPGAPDRAE